MTNLLGLIGDGCLAVLLLITIGYCARLSRRIRLLQDTRSELGGMIAQFDQATSRAMTAVADLQTTAKRITEALHLKIEKANFLADDLAFLIEKSTKLSTQIEQQAKALAALPAKPPAPLKEAMPATVAKPKPSVWQPAQARPAEMPSSFKSAASLEALLSRLAAPVGSATTTAPPPPAPRSDAPSGPRTGAERELLDALKSGR